MLTTKRYEYLQFDQIGFHPSIGNHRQLSSAKVIHLEKDILKNGLLEPLVVWERLAGQYFLVGGFHRFEAIKIIRSQNPGYFDRVDVRVVAGDPDEIKALNLKLNADRQDIKITDYFETVIYLNNVNWSSEKIALFLDKSVSWIEDIIRYAPMVNEQILKKLQSSEISWSRAKQIIQKSLKAPAGLEKIVMDEQLSKTHEKSFKPLTFRSALKHFGEMKKNDPDVSFTIKLDHLSSLIRVLQGKQYDENDVKCINELFPDLVAKG